MIYLSQREKERGRGGGKEREYRLGNKNID